MSRYYGHITILCHDIHITTRLGSMLGLGLGFGLRPGLQVQLEHVYVGVRWGLYIKLPRYIY